MTAESVAAIQRTLVDQTIEKIRDQFILNRGFITWRSDDSHLSSKSFYVTCNVQDKDLFFILKIGIGAHEGKNLVSVDRISHYDKESHCPLHFGFPLSKRKMKRVESALAILRHPKQKMEYAFFIPGFDDFDHHTRTDFYSSFV